MRHDQGGRRWSERAEDDHDARWLEARARGEAADHPDPERGQAYIRLEGALARLDGPEPPPGWQARVWSAIDRAEAPWWRRAGTRLASLAWRARRRNGDVRGSRGAGRER